MKSEEFITNVIDGNVKLGMLSYFDNNPGTAVEGRWLILEEIYVQKPNDMFRKFVPDEQILVRLTKEQDIIKREFKLKDLIATYVS